MDREYRRLMDDFQIQKNTWGKELPEEIQLIEEEKREFIDQNLGSMEDLIQNYNISNSNLSLRNANIEKEILRFQKKSEEQRFLHERLKCNTESLISAGNNSQVKKEGH